MTKNERYHLNLHSTKMLDVNSGVCMPCDTPAIPTTANNGSSTEKGRIQEAHISSPCGKRLSRILNIGEQIADSDDDRGFQKHVENLGSMSNIARMPALLIFLSTMVVETSADGESSTSSSATTTEIPPRGPLPDHRPEVAHYVASGLLILFMIYGIIKMWKLLKKTRQYEVKPPMGLMAVECAKCQKAQYILQCSKVFICFACRIANQVPAEEFSGGCTEALQKAVLSRVSGQFWKIEQQVAMGEALTLGAQTDADLEATETQSNLMPACVVCMDEPGNMVLLPCAHSGLCESCAKKVMQNTRQAPSCPTCRMQITTMLKLTEVRQDCALGEEVRIPIARRLPIGQRVSDQGSVIPGTEPSRQLDPADTTWGRAREALDRFGNRLAGDRFE